MDQKRLQYFVCVADAKSFSRAASLLKVAQPTLSRQIALLESDVGHKLFVRTGRGVTPSEAGAALLVHARRLLEGVRMARDELQELNKSPPGRIRIGLPPRLSLAMSAPLVQRFRQKLPRALISITEAQSPRLRESLIAGEIDLAVLFDPPPSQQLSYEPLFREQLVLVSSKNGPKLPPRVSLAGLAKYPMVLAGAPNAIRSLIDALLRPKRTELKLVAEVGAVQTVLTLVSQGIGCTILPAGALSLGASGTKLQWTPIGPPSVNINVVLAVPKAGASSRLLRETIELLKGMDFTKMGDAPEDV